MSYNEIIVYNTKDQRPLFSMAVLETGEGECACFEFAVVRVYREVELAVQGCHGLLHIFPSTSTLSL